MFNGMTPHFSKGSYDLFVASYSTTGVHRWSRSFGNKGSDFGHGVAVDSAGNVYVTGGFFGLITFGGTAISGNGGGDTFVASFSSTGKHRWSKGFGDKGKEVGRGVAVDTSGAVYATGYYYSGNHTYTGVDFGGGPIKGKGYSDVYVASFTSSGAHRWSKIWGSPNFDNVNDITTDTSGNVYITGDSSPGIDFGGGTLKSSGKYDLFVASFSSTGGHRWSRAHGDVDNDTGRRIATDNKAGVLVTGSFYGSPSPPYQGIGFGGAAHWSKGESDALLFKLEP